MSVHVKNYYFTMGVGERHETGMPFQGGHVLVKAETLGDARRKYMAKYPHPHYPKTVGNYAFDYNQKQWDAVVYKYEKTMGVRHDTIE